jgi:hypothetical protein
MSPQQGLASVQRPVTADVLSSWLGSVGWMRNHLPNLARVVEPLRELKNEASKLVGSLNGRPTSSASTLTRRACGSPLTTSRGARPSPSCATRSRWRMYPKQAVFSDASDMGWGTLVAQYPREQHGHVGVLSACSGSGAPASC